MVTNDIFTREDAEFLTRRGALEQRRIVAVETGGCPHAAIREDVSANLMALEGLQRLLSLKKGSEGGREKEPAKTQEGGVDLLLVESGGDNLAANFSRELADFIIYVIDVAGGDKVPRKGGPGITGSDLLVVNKCDLAEAVGSDLDVMARDAERMREGGPTVFTEVRNDGKGVDKVAELIIDAWKAGGGYEVSESRRKKGDLQ